MYVLYLLFATLVRSVAFVNDMLFEVPRSDIIGGFHWNMRLLVLIILKYYHFVTKFEEKNACRVAEITLTPQNLQS